MSVFVDNFLTYCNIATDTAPNMHVLIYEDVRPCPVMLDHNQTMSGWWALCFKPYI